MVMGTSTASLYSLPYDLLYQIVKDLDCIDYINLSRTNRTLYSLLQNELLAKRSIENSVREAKEAQQAFAGNISFRQAIGRIYDIRQAVAYANPYSVAVLAYASTFLYKDGVLSYYCANEIRVLNVHQAAHTEQVLDVRNVFRRIIPAFREDEAQGVSVEISFLYYSAGLLAILAEFGDTSPWLILLDVTPHRPACNRGRLRFLRQLSCTRRLFVRHNDNHLFYGVYSTVGLSSDPQWSVQWVDLTKNTDNLATNPILLDKFAGTDIGQNVCFEIFDNHLYAVTSALDPNEEQLHSESFYEWTCIAPESRVRRAMIRRIFRRLHTEGPINDTWSEISLRVDEATGRPMITECRREWLQNRTDNVRTYYTEPLMRPSELSTATAEDKFARITREAEQPTSPHVTPLISAASSHYPLITGGAGPSNMTVGGSPPAASRQTSDGTVIRSNKYKHTEYSDSTVPKRDFILAKTKYRAYNSSAAAFVDLINDPEPSTSVGVVQDRLRLRICSRKRKQVEIKVDNTPAENPPKRVRQSENSESEEQQYVSNGVKLWPADNADQDLLDLLCPAKRAANIHGASDERTLVYSVDIDTDEPHRQAIILVGFDPRIRLPSMRNRKRKSDGSLSVGTKHNRRVGIVLPRLRDIKDSSTVSDEGLQQSPPRPRSVRTEDAMHLSINRGYWFDRGHSCTDSTAQ